MIKFDDGIIVVEGKDDKATLSRVIQANIFILHGMTGINQKCIDNLKELSKNNKIYVLTDPDYAGKKIRQKIEENIPNVIHLYAKRSSSTKGDDIGIENLKYNDIIEIFNKIPKHNKEKTYTFSMNDMLSHNLSIGENSRLKREILGDILAIGYCNTNQLIKKLNAINISYEEFLSNIDKMNQILETKDKNAGIFGKFFPVHRGHINFIKSVSKMCKNLYVFVCEETTRDKKINEESKLPNMTIKDRKQFVLSELKGYKNIKVEVLNEDGIEEYPNGWENWKNRVNEKIKEKNLKIDIFFTNEVQDKENYEKYFNKKAYLIDPDRIMYCVSSTKIRNNPEKYMEYIPDSVKKWLDK